MGLWLFGCAALAVAALVVVTFNELIASRNRVRAAWSDIDVALQRRHDLIPALVAAVQGYAAHEQAVLGTVATLRSRAMATQAVGERGAIEAELASGVQQLLALAERYPELKASANFLALQRELVDTEDRLQRARSDYNEAVRRYNTGIERFPERLLARPSGFRAFEFFQTDATATPRA
jgi:LemA protein